ncbi:hypothetical protein SANTM175S_05812 [Streptomyces antimycoticus]
MGFTYDAAGRELERRLGNHTSLTQTWDQANRLTTQNVTTRHQAEADHILQHRSYTHGTDGYLAEIRELTSGTRRFEHDPVGRVTRVHGHGWSESYTYDTAGNLSHATAPTHNAPGDRSFTGTIIHRAGRTTYEHDAAGRLTRRTRRLLNGQTRTWTYTWDTQDRLDLATTPDGKRWRYLYDPLGRRTTKQRLQGDGTVADLIHFTWDGARLAEQTISGGTATTWDYAPGTHRPVSQSEHTERSTPVPGPSASSPADTPQSAKRRSNSTRLSRIWSARQPNSSPLTAPSHGKPAPPSGAFPSPPHQARWTAPSGSPANTPTRKPVCITTSSGTTTRRRPAISPPTRLASHRPTIPTPTLSTP